MGSKSSTASTTQTTTQQTDQRVAADSSVVLSGEDNSLTLNSLDPEFAGEAFSKITGFTESVLDRVQDQTDKVIAFAERSASSDDKEIAQTLIYAGAAVGAVWAFSKWKG